MASGNVKIREMVVRLAKIPCLSLMCLGLMLLSTIFQSYNDSQAAICCCSLEFSMANKMDPDQTALYGAVHAVAGGQSAKVKHPYLKKHTKNSNNTHTILP